MTAVLLSVHVLAAIVLIGPITVAASLFPRYARAEVAQPDQGNLAVLRALHRITSGYAVAALVVPVFGLATAVQLKVLGDPWLITSIALTAIAAALLAVVIVPTQREVLTGLTESGPERQLPGERETVPRSTGESGPARRNPGESPPGSHGPGEPTTGKTTTGGTTDGEPTAGELAAGERLPVGLLPQLAMRTGLFALTWAVVVVLMIVRPGSTTGS